MKDEIYTIIYKDYADPIWDHVVLIRSEYPNLTDEEFMEMCSNRYYRLEMVFDVVKMYNAVWEGV